MKNKIALDPTREVDGAWHTRYLREDLLASIDARLLEVSDDVELQVERAHLLDDLNRPEEAAEARRQATQARIPSHPRRARAYRVLPYRGKTLPITVLLVVGAEGSDARLQSCLDDQTFLVLRVIADFHHPGLVLPPHQVVIDGVRDADASRGSSEAAAALFASMKAPIIRASAHQLADDRGGIRELLFAHAFPATSAGTGSPTDSLREFLLRQMDARLARAPGDVELAIERANLLMEMDRLEEARQIYSDILAKNPNHFVALNNMGILLNRLGYHAFARDLFRLLVSLQPDNTKARVNFAHRLRESSEVLEARTQYEHVLREQPDLAEAHLGLAQVLMYLGETASAWEHEAKAAAIRPVLRFRGSSIPGAPRVVILASPCGGNAPILRLLDRKNFATLSVVTDFHPLSEPLPPHDVVFNTIGDADHCQTSLDAAERILETVTGPVLNLPARIRPTDRAGNARILGALDGVVTGRMALFPREKLTGTNAVAELQAQGIAFPLLLRTPGFHGGSHFLRVEDAAGLDSAVATLPGPELLAIQYLDARDADGKIRKYRVMMVDGKMFPLHKAVSEKWMIHYFSADMVNNAAHRAEDAAFLEDMPGVLGSKAMEALQRIADTLGLDYAGADFSLSPGGEILLFEANATMVAPSLSRGAEWDYRREPVQRIHDAVREMVRRRAQGRAA